MAVDGMAKTFVQNNHAPQPYSSPSWSTHISVQYYLFFLYISEYESNIKNVEVMYNNII